MARYGDDFTIRDVARVAGCSPALIMQRFGSRTGLLRSAIEFQVERIQTHDLPPGNTLEEDARRLVALLIPTNLQDYDKPKALRTLANEVNNPEMRIGVLAHFDATKNLISQLITRHTDLRGESANRAAAALEAIFHGTMVVHAVRGGGNIRSELRSAFMDFVANLDTG